MSSITVELNGTRITTVDLAPLHLLSVSVSGSLYHEELAMLDVHGGQYGDGGRGFLTWVGPCTLQPGDVVNVVFGDDCDACDSAAPGKTMAELYPDDPPCTDTDFTIDAQKAAALRALPQRHDAFLVQAQTSSGQQASAASDARHTDFSFDLSWAWIKPREARVRLNTHCLDDVLDRKTGMDHLQTTVAPGASTAFTLVR